MRGINYSEVLDFFFWGFEVFSRRDCGLILAGLRVCDSERRSNQLLERLQRRGWIERRGRGKSAKFTITAAGCHQVRVSDPAKAWNKPWDGKWRVFNYDLPETQRNDRILLWRSLHAHKLGLLQRSLWIWPHEVETTLRTIVKTEGIPECFCGFRSDRLFLCSDAEVVDTAWDWDEIHHQHQIYLKRTATDRNGLNKTHTLPALARLAKAERAAYADAFSTDPLLPRPLWRKPYTGPAVEQAHQTFRAGLHRRLYELLS